MRWSVRQFLLIGGLALLAVAVIILVAIPDLPERAGWHWQEFWATTRRQLLQLPDTLPTPAATAAVAPALTPRPTPTLAAALQPSATPVATLAPRPAHIELTGFTQIWQRVNNCGPATLAMGLNYWGWKGTQANTANALKPDQNDRNVSPAELAGYARKAGLGAEVRLGGTLELVRQFVAAGFPVMLETTLILPEKGWEGHYTLITGYSDERQQFTAQDSLRGPNFIENYADLEKDWRSFDFVYLVLFPAERAALVQTLLGPAAEPAAAARQAADLARQETTTLTGEDLGFAWFNLGTSLTALSQWPEAAAAYDAARQAGLPFRMLWYQQGPLEAYYQAGRYADVIALAEATLAQADNVEEVYYWRGRSRLAQNDQAGALADFRTAIGYNRYYTAPIEALAELGLKP